MTVPLHHPRLLPTMPTARHVTMPPALLMPTLRVLTMIVVLIPATWAVELAVRDIDLGLVSWPRSFDWKLSSEVVDDSGRDAFAGAGGLRVGMRWSLSRPGSAVGLMASGDVMMLTMQYQGSEGLNAIAGRIGLGGAWAVRDSVTLSAEVGAGYGLGTMRFPASVASTASSVDGTMLLYDAQARVTWHLARQWSINASVGWVVASHSLSGSGTSIDLDQDGLMFGLGIGWRYSDLPPLLE